MIEINLLPEDRRKKKRKKIVLPKMNFLPVAVSVLGGLIALHAIAGAIILAKRHQLKVMNGKLDQYIPKKIEFDKLKFSYDKINRKQNTIDRLTEGRLIWAKKLNDISDSMIPGVWLTELYIDEQTEFVTLKPAAGAKPNQAPKTKSVTTKYLVLEGYASSMFGEETAIVGKFIKSLKENESFFVDFDDIKLDSIQSSRLNEVEVMSFKIYCFLSDKESVKAP
jgi:hypothetical protein